MDQQKEIQRCLTTSYLRQCRSELENTIVLVLTLVPEKKSSLNFISKYMKIDRTNLRRAVWAYINGYKPRMTGRPPVLNPSEELYFYEKIKLKCKEKDPLTSEDLLDEVRKIYLNIDRNDY